MRVVAVINQKGGVGKTTTAVNLGAALALRERKVLLIDLDPQGNLTDHLGLEPEDPEGDERATSYDVLMGDVALKDAILPTATPNLYVVPSSQDLAAVELELADTPGREMRLKQALAALPPRAYDWVLIDCPPSLGLLALNAMAAAREVFITLQTEYLALKGLGQLDKTVTLVREQVNPELIISGIVATLVDPVTNLAREVIDEVRSVFGHRVFETRVRKNVRLAEAPSHGTHIFTYAPASTGAADYHALAEEVEAWDPVAGRAHAPGTRPPSVPVVVPVSDPVPPSGPARPGARAQAKAATPAAPPPAPAPVAKGAAAPKAPPAGAPPAPPAPAKPAPAAKAGPAGKVEPAAPAPAPSQDPPRVGGRFAPRTPAPAAAPTAAPAKGAVPPAAPKAPPAPQPKPGAAKTSEAKKPGAAAPAAAPPAKAPPAPPARPAVPSPQLRHPRPWMKPSGK